MNFAIQKISKVYAVNFCMIFIKNYKQTLVVDKSCNLYFWISMIL